MDNDDYYVALDRIDKAASAILPAITLPWQTVIPIDLKEEKITLEALNHLGKFAIDVQIAKQSASTDATTTTINYRHYMTLVGTYDYDTDRCGPSRHTIATGYGFMGSNLYPYSAFDQYETFLRKLASYLEAHRDEIEQQRLDEIEKYNKRRSLFSLCGKRKCEDASVAKDANAAKDASVANDANAANDADAAKDASVANDADAAKDASAANDADAANQ
jgi:hypothetical protein